MKQFYVVFIPHRKIDGKLVEKINFSHDGCLNTVTKHYRNLYEHEIVYYSKWTKEKWIRMGNDEGCTVEPDSYEIFKKWVKYDPKTLEDIIKFYNDLSEELDICGWGLQLNYSNINDTYEIVKLC